MFDSFAFLEQTNRFLYIVTIFNTLFSHDEDSYSQRNMTYAINDDHDGAFVFSKNISVEEGGKVIKCQKCKEANSINKLVQYTETPLSESCPYFSATIRRIDGKLLSKYPCVAVVDPLF